MKVQESGCFFEKKLRKRRFLILVFAGMGLTISAHQSEAAPRLGYEPAIVQISGTLVIENHYGPPNYGENPTTDMKVEAFILKLDPPVDVIANPSNTNSGLDRDSFFSVNRMQLTGPPGITAQFSSLIGDHITLNGQLFERENGNHYTDVLMFVQGIVHPTGTSS